jgi:hypothetical protein
LPGHHLLVKVGHQILKNHGFHISLTYIWQCLYQFYFPNQEYINWGFEYLEKTEDGDRGAWRYVWETLWNDNINKPRLEKIAQQWLASNIGKEKHRTLVQTRLNETKV